MSKKYLVKFNCCIGDYEHTDIYIFDKQMTEYQYCKKFWGLSEKNELKTNIFWDDSMENTIEVIYEKQLTQKQADTLGTLEIG